MPDPLADRPREIDGGIMDPFKIISPLSQRRLGRALRTDVLAELGKVLGRHFIVLVQLRPRLNRAEEGQG